MLSIIFKSRGMRPLLCRAFSKDCVPKKPDCEPKPAKVPEKEKKMEICGKVAVVTGGSTGVGKATVKELVLRGAKVSIIDIDHKKGKALSDCINDTTGCMSTIFYKCDVTILKKFKEAFKDAEQKLGCVNILFNNAGIMNDDPKMWSKQVDVNLKGVINGCLVAMDFMGKKNGGPGGTVVNSASILAIKRSSLMPIHNATKAGVLALTRSLGTEFHHDLNCIRYMALVPSTTETGIFENLESKLLIPGPDMKELYNSKKKDLVFQTPECVAKCVVTMLEQGDNGSAWLIEKDKPCRVIKFCNNLKFSGSGTPPSSSANA